MVVAGVGDSGRNIDPRTKKKPGSPIPATTCVQKKIRAAHAKEKQQIR